MHHITVSVVIPAWNCESTLRKVVESALAQTLPPVEVVICDDGSSDASLEIAGDLCKHDERVKLSVAGRGGRPAIPRNRGIKQSCGEWIAFLDSDDVWLPNKLEEQLRAAAEFGVMAACSNAFRLLPDEGVVGNLLDTQKRLLSFEDLLTVNSVVCSSAVVHRSVLNVVGGFPEQKELRALEDYALWLRVATQTNFVYLAEPLLTYRDDPAASVRVGGLGYWPQRKAVLSDLVCWAENYQKSSYGSLKDHLAPARKALRKARARTMEREVKSLVRSVVGRARPAD